jgi:hypothetical protein
MMRTRAIVLGIVLTFLPASVRAQRHRAAAVPQQIIEQIMRDTASFELMPRRLDSLAANLVAKPMDLNADGIPELEIHGINSICGANNCATWIYRRTGSGYERLLEAGSIQDLEVESAVSHGYRDIITSGHASASDFALTRYKFDGREYRRVGCFWKTYHYLDAHRHLHNLRRARTASVACGADR